MKKILIIFTGGTISMVKDEATNASLPAMSGEDILQYTPAIRNMAAIDCLNFSMIPSPHMTPEKMLELSELITAKTGLAGYDGVVVTHGTDSLEETAYLVDLTYQGTKPVIFVGSMRNSSEPGWDGPTNLTDAVLVALSDEAANRGVMVVMNREIHLATLVTKTSTSALDTFKSKDFGPVGFVDDNKVYFYYSYHKREYIPAEKIDSQVDLIKCACGMDDRLLRFCVDAGTHGMVLEGMGRGNIPPQMVTGVAYALHRGIPVVLVSRCPSGRVMVDYGYAGAGWELSQMGVILGNNLPGQKARIKLMVALGLTLNVNEIKDCFEKNFY